MRSCLRAHFHKALSRTIQWAIFGPVFFAEDFAETFRSRAHALLQLDLAGFIQHEVPAVAISQIQSDR
jgi:hypothetical protein